MFSITLPVLGILWFSSRNFSENFSWTQLTLRIKENLLSIAHTSSIDIACVNTHFSQCGSVMKSMFPFSSFLFLKGLLVCFSFPIYHKMRLLSFRCRKKFFSAVIQTLYVFAFSQNTWSQNNESKASSFVFILFFYEESFSHLPTHMFLISKEATV